jgi:hypothetical protein
MSLSGPFSDVGARNREVRFTPVNRHRQPTRLRPKSANPRNRRPTKNSAHRGPTPIQPINVRFRRVADLSLRKLSWRFPDRVYASVERSQRTLQRRRNPKHDTHGCVR